MESGDWNTILASLVYFKLKDRKEWLVICLYVDNLLIGGDNESVQKMTMYLKEKYNVSLEGKIK